MKNFYFLTNLFSSGADVRSNVVRVRDGQQPTNLQRISNLSLTLTPFRLVKWVAVLCLLVTLGVGNAWGTDPVATLTFTKACGGSGTDSEGNSWTIASDVSESTYSNAQGIHYGTNDISVDHVNISTTAITSTVSQVVVEASRGGNNVSLSVSVGSTSFKCGGNTSVALTTTNTSYTFTGSASGTILVHLYKPGGSATKKAIYCKSVAVTHAAGSTYAVTYNANGDGAGAATGTTGNVPTDASSPYAKDATVTVLGNVGSPALAKAGHTFIGWNTAADGSGTPYSAGNTFTMGTSAVTLYAQWKSNAAEKTFNLVEDVSKLSAGQHIVIVSYYSSTYYAMSSDRGNNRLAVAANASEFTMSNSNKTLSTASTTSLEMLTLTSTDAGYFGFQALNGNYLYAAGSTSNYLKTKAYAGGTLDNDSKWKITLSEGDFSVQADQSSNRYDMRYNYNSNNPPLFNCYATGGSNPRVLIYAEKTCDDLGSINGSVSWSNGSKATLVWDKDANATGYVVKWKTHAGAEGTYATTNVSSINDTLTTKKTCAISSLTAGTEYDFKIFITGKTSPTVYCDKDSTMTSIAPKITVKSAPVALTGSDYAEGATGGGTVKTFIVSGVGLTGALTFTAPTNFQVSTDNGSTWSTSGGSKTLAASGTLSETTIKVRLVEGLSEGSYGGATTYVTISGGSAAAVNSSVSIAGTVSSACSAPTVATPNLASIASGTITPSCASVTVDENCDVTDYGFVWKASSDPTIDDNKTSVGNSTPASSFSSDLSISFTTGNTYKIKAYAINSAGTTLSSTLTVTPQKVTFNSNGGSDVADKYVNKDTKVTAPSDPTKTGYTFNGWYREVGCTNAWTFGTDVVSKDTTLYAKWTANQYDVTLSPNSGSGSDQTVSATYDGDMPLVIKTAGTAIVVPTRTGYDFGGYYNTSAASGGTQYYTYTGNPKALGSARTWNVANSTTTLYARWTPHQHKVSVSAAANGTITATPAGGSAISEGSYNATVDYDKTITLGWTKDDHYNTLVWTVHKDGDESTTVSVTGSGNGATFTMPDYDVVVKATISEDPYTLVTFKNNGTAISGYEDIKYYSGRPTPPTMTDGHSTGDACDEDSEVFYGWTADSWEYKISKTAASAKTIYKKGDNLPTVAASGDVVVYNAVWAEEVVGEDFEIVTSLSNIKEGKAYLGSYINYSSSWRWYMATAANESKTVTVSGTPKKLSSTSGLVEVTLVATATANQYYIKDGNDKYLYANNTGDVLEFSATSCAWTFSSYDNYMFVVLSSLGTYYMRGFASSTSAGGIRTYASSSTNSGICLFQKGTDLSNFMTHCCDDLITLGTPSISNGTITYDWDSPIPTCNSGKTVTATITPSTGYKVTALTFSGGSVSYDDPDFPITSATNVTLTFAQNTDAATLSASATTAAIPVTSLKLRAQQTGQDDKIGNDLTMTCYPKEGQTGGNDPLNHSLNVAFNEVLPANALDKTYDWSVRVKAKGDADWTAVSFTGNALNTNTIINSYNKSTGNLQIKATEGTAEIKITAHDGSGVTAKVTITVANVAMTGVSVDPTSMAVYAGQKKAVAVTFAPLNATNKAYSAGSSYTYVNIQNKAAATFNIEGKTSVTSATVNETVTVTTTDGSFTATVDVTIKPLPLVHFVDNVHNESFDDVVATTDGTTVTFAKATPTHDDLDEPGSGNTCEKSHLHLIGWIRGDWPAYVAYMNGTGDAPSNSDLTGATGYFYAPGASITLTDAMHGKTFYAIWAKVE